MKTVLTGLIAGVVAVCGLIAQQTQSANVTGTWQIDYHDKNGVEVDRPKVTLHQSGDKLTGVFGNRDWKVEGAVTGDAVVFWFHPPQRPDITVKYQGKLEKKDLIRGAMASEVQSGVFTATRE